MNIVLRLVSLLFMFCLPVFLVLSVVRGIVAAPFTYEMALSISNAEIVTGIDSVELMIIGKETSDYLLGRSGPVLDPSATLSDGSVIKIFNKREIDHMVDVRELMNKLWTLHEFMFLLIIVRLVISFLFDRKESLLKISQETRISGMWGLIFLVFTGVSSLLLFDQFFLQFHEIFFSIDLWQLDPKTDRLIQIYPRDFWFGALFVTASFVIFLLLTVSGLAHWYLRSAANASDERGQLERQRLL